MLELTILLISLVGNAFLGGTVFKSNPRSQTNRLFGGLVLVTIVWLITTYMAVKVQPDIGIILVRITMMLAAFQILFLFLFVHTFPDTQLPLSKKIVTISMAGAAVVSLIAMSPYMFTSISKGSATPGPAIVIFLLYAVVLVGNAIYTLIRKTLRSRGLLRRQLRYLAFGIIVSFGLIALSNLLSVVFLRNTQFVNFTPVYILVLVSSIAYAIIAEHLFDIRVIIRRTVVFSTLVGFIFASYSVLIFVATQVLGIDAAANQRFSLLYNIAIALIIGFSFQPIRHWIEDLTERWLYKKEYEQQAVLKDLSDKLNNVVGLDEALESVMQTIAKVLHLHHAITYVFQPGENNTLAIKRVKQIGYSSSARLILEDKDFTVQYFSKNPEICLVQDIAIELEQERALIEHKHADAAFIRQHAIKQAVLKKLQSLEVAVAIPLHLNTQPIGLILLSEQLSGEAFNSQDITLLDLVGAQAISSIQKAKLFEGDQMKSEFVSIASHELLTPISAIEGYLSMILEENIGHVDDQARDYLNKVYTSAKRLSLLIKDLLSVSRIESGKMKIEPQQLDITKMINDTLDQLKFVAADKKLALSLEKPARAVPPVWADPDRTMQVLVNLVSNAIKYTPKGSVTITTEANRHEGLVSVSITDTGLGMTKEQMSHLFTKFYRIDTPETTGITGTGLGLYITKSIIEKMGGSITCKSTQGRGSTFTFTLPIFKVETSAVQ